MIAAIRARGLVKRFGAFTAVDGIDLDVPTGSFYGVLGPNGAGKTTTMKMITCVSPPTEGELHVLGAYVGGDRRALKRRLGVVPQGLTLDQELTVRENLLSQGAYHGMGRKATRDRADELLAFVQLGGRGDDTVEQLSGGMQRRLLVARALVSDPELLVLDEPTTGLDPQARHLVWERLRSLRRLGKTVLITTHYMDEAARLCDEIVVFDAGRVVARGTPERLVADHVPPRVVELHTEALSAEEVAGVVGDLARDVETLGDRVLIFGDDGAAVVDRIQRAELAVERVLVRDATLEDVFLRLTGHALVD